MARDIDYHVFSTHHATRTDGTPLHYISAEQLAYFNALEALVLAMFMGISEILPKATDDV